MDGKTKILCLHGYRQNGPKFKNQTGSFRKLLKEVDFHYLSAPHQVIRNEGTGTDEDERSWWFTRPNMFSSRDKTDVNEGFSESVAEVEKCFKEKGPFHGILGFSQGGAFAGLLCALKQKKKIDLDFQFVIIFSGFLSMCTVHTEYYNEEIKINSLHVIGEADEIIPKDMSYLLAKKFTNPTILLHPGGHFVPGHSSMKNDYLNFIKAQKNS